MKRKLYLIFIAACVLVLALVACASVESVYFDEKPRTTYVQGQDIDLDGAVITALKGGKEESVDPADVIVSGYDKNTLGKQTVTFTYGDVSTTLDVTVIPRIAVEGATTSYFVGDKLDKTKGRIKVANDKGVTSTINMSESKVTVTGFDSTTPAQTQTLTVTYGDYTGTFDVSIYAVGNVELTKKPNKTLYYSHEDKLDTAGAYFTVSANGVDFERMVELDAATVEGFDPSLATLEHVDSPLAQSLKIKYLGYSFDFDITVKYSAVSLMQLRAGELASLTDLTAASKEQGENAIAAISAYFDLGAAEKRLVSAADKNTVVSVAAVYAYAQYVDSLSTFSSSFTLDSHEQEDGDITGVFSIVASDYESVRADVDRLALPDEPFIKYGSLLLRLEDEFNDTAVLDKETLNEYFELLYGDEAIDVITGLLSLMTDLYEDLADVPEDWTVDMLDDYVSNIKSAVVRIQESEYKPFSYIPYFEIYEYLSAWREKDDYYDIIYAYYYEYETDGVLDTLWENVPMPDELQAVYLMVRYAIDEIDKMTVGSDTTGFMYYYKGAVEAADKIKNGDDQLIKDIYEEINFDSVIDAYFYVGQYVDSIAYVYHSASLLGNARYEALMAHYLDMISLVDEDKNIDFTNADNLAKAKELLVMYSELTPSEQFALFSALHCDYRYNLLNDLVLNQTEDDDGNKITYNWFAGIILRSHEQTLTAEGFDVFSRLFCATELYALRYTDDEAYGKFMSEMEAILDEAQELPTADLDQFSFLLEKYEDYYNECKNPTTPDVSAYEAQLAELNALVDVFFEISHFIDTNDLVETERLAFYTLLVATSDKANELAKTMLNGANDSLEYYYLNTLVTFDTARGDDEAEDITCTYDFILDEMRASSVRFLVLSSITIQLDDGEDYDYNSFHLYDNEQYQQYLLDAYYVLLAGYKGTASELAAADVLEIMALYRSLDEKAITSVGLLRADTFYYEAVRGCFYGKLSDEAYSVFELLIQVEKLYTVAVSDDTEYNVNAYKSAVAGLSDMLNSLDDTSELNDFGDAFNFHNAKAAEMTVTEPEN